MIFGGRRWSLTTALSPEQCVERLAAEVDSPLSFGGAKPLVGKVTPSGAVLRRRFSGRNVFQAELKARFQAEGEGTRVFCRTGMNRVTALFSIAWLSYVLLIAVGGGLMIATGNMQPAPGVSKSALGLMPLLMAGFAVAIVVLGRRLVRRETLLLGRFLADRLEPASVGEGKLA